MSKKKITAIVISIIIIISGIIPLIIGIIREKNNQMGNLPVLDHFNISEEDVGKEFRGNIESMPFLTEKTDDTTLFLMCYVEDENIEDSECLYRLGSV